MTKTLPTRSRSYVGELTNTDIWSTFQLRPDDVVVCTPPKCGTTWTQSIVMMLVFGKPGMDIGIDDISRWLDCGFRDREAIAAVFDAQNHRRCIKSHTPFDGITYSPDVTYLFVYRHPMDVHFSMRKHNNNMKADRRIDQVDSRFPDDFGEGFRMFVEDEISSEGNDELTLDSITRHYRSARKWDHLPNVHLFHYADMTRNLTAEMNRFADILGYDYTPSLIEEIVKGATFSTMKTNAVKHQPPTEDSHFELPAEFFSTATSNKWEKHLTETDLEAYKSRIADLLPQADIDWLEWGNALR